MCTLMPEHDSVQSERGGGGARGEGGEGKGEGGGKEGRGPNRKEEEEGDF